MCKFAIKKEVKEVLFVAQQSDIIRILVMNNSDFDMLRSLQKKEYGYYDAANRKRDGD